MKKSGDKGKGYERKIAQRLSDWCGIELIRTPMSGAWPGTSGDILPKVRHQSFPFLIECKKEEDWCLEQVLAGNGLFHREWLVEIPEKITKDESHGHPIGAWMLIFSRNRKPDYIAYPLSLIPEGWQTVNVLTLRTATTPLVVMELEQFLQLYTYASLVVGLSLDFQQQGSRTVLSDIPIE